MDGELWAKGWGNHTETLGEPLGQETWLGEPLSQETWLQEPPRPNNFKAFL